MHTKSNDKNCWIQRLNVINIGGNMDARACCPLIEENIYPLSVASDAEQLIG